MDVHENLPVQPGTRLLCLYIKTYVYMVGVVYDVTCNVEFTTFTILHTYVDIYTSHIQQHAAPVTSRTLSEEPDGVHPLQVEGVCMCQIILGDLFV